ncbi:nicotinate-nucleotide--dimethylbenzimidazole phosphoribosyltransferase [Corynebacterium sp. Marseille-P4321]|uniref:nicotinate-nucleotide--dimethylbenzimidazole phosphoribosyltransferase n=1 Tax=Corynebacterium sp. Marseille-P4321 TaxID=2736603 RepID=UPI00158C9EA7|nr:nicotinate-nucleotide--dimethylbenzimidazole phosphoribosyltransferase [Corynebacterium sp. Marseille-P4321]
MAPAEFPPVQAPAESHARRIADELERTPGGRSLGRLGAVGGWIAAAQHSEIPAPFARARAVVVAGEHGIARHGVSAWKPEATRAQAEQIAAGAGPVHAAARLANASVRLVDEFLDHPTGCIDTEPAMTPEEFEEALALGVQIADSEVDAGADILIPGDVGVGNTTVAAAIHGTFTFTEPVEAIGRGSGINDEVWKTKVAVIRDAMFRVRGRSADTAGVLTDISGPDFACLVGLIAQAAVRKTPLLIDGAYVAQAAYVAERLAPGAKRWCMAGQLSPEPSHVGALQALGLTPVLALDMTTGQAAGALAALPQLNLAAELVGDVLSGAVDKQP